MTERELEHVLRDLGAHLDWPPTPPLAEAVGARLRAAPAAGRRRARRWLPVGRSDLAGLPWTPGRRLAVAALAVVVLAAVILVASPAGRDAVAGLLGFRKVKIKVGGPAPSTVAPSATSATPGRAAGLGLGERTTLVQAAAKVGFRVLVPTAAGLGRPDEVYVGEPPPGGQVSLVYAARPGLPANPPTPVGLLVSEFRGATPDPGFFEKVTREGGRVEQVGVGGARGYWLTGRAHFFLYVDAMGRIDLERVRLAGNTLVWQHGDLIVRIEGAATKEQALRIAESMR